jgi:predicted Rossmann fold nucleotide-binding protein DprA/Smf involved in DNA uptake
MTDNLARIVFCSDLGYDPADSKTLVRPFTPARWGKLETLLTENGLTPADLLTLKTASIAEKIGLSADEITKIEMLMLRADKLGAEIDKLAENGIFITTPTALNYPTKLQKAMKQNAPITLYYSGELKLLERETTAIIGSRKANETELKYAAKHAKISAQNGVTVISGGAKGIDSAAAESAINAGGAVAVYVSDSMAKFARKNRDLIRENRMVVLSSFNPYAPFRGYNALERNKFIYASADYAVVVSSGDGTGGSFKGAEYCIKHNLTKLFIRDSEDAPQGNRRLLSLGGSPVNDNHERFWKK